MKPKEPRPLTNLQTPHEQLTFYSMLEPWLYNSWQNMYNICDSKTIQELLWTHKDESALKDSYAASINQIQDMSHGQDPRRRTMVIFGAGASATEYEKELPWIFGNCYTIATPTVLPWLGSMGFYPDVVVNADPHPILGEYAAASGAADHSMLVCCPETSPMLPLLFTRGRTYWYRTSIGGLDNEEPYNVFMTLLFKFIRLRIAQQGCVTNIALTVANALKQFAGWDWDQILLIGCDFGFWQGYQRLPLDGGELPQIAAPTYHEGDAAELVQWKGTATNHQMLRYKAQTMLTWMHAALKIWSWSHGILEEFPVPSRKEVRSGEFPEYPNTMQVRQKATNYLAWFQRWLYEVNEKARAEFENRKAEKSPKIIVPDAQEMKDANRLIKNSGDVL